MKTKMLSLIILLVLSITTVMAQTEKKEKFEVAGNCGMCETRIEKAAKSVEGVSSAEWDKETKMIEVILSSDEVDIHKVHMAIAKVGHDTKMHKASDDVYDKLPACCKYERISEEPEPDKK
jgi:mercuric ion binding protein